MEKTNEKKQAKLLIIAISIPLIGGITTEALPEFLNFTILPLSTTLTTITSIIIAHAIFNYNLMMPVRFGIQRKLIAGFLLIILLSNTSGYWSLL